jgi:PilZ domain
VRSRTELRVGLARGSSVYSYPFICLAFTSNEWATFTFMVALSAATGYWMGRIRAKPTAADERTALRFANTSNVPQAGPGSEQRVHPRYDTQPFKLRLTTANGGPEIDGLVLNQSMGGLCICVSKPILVGAVLNLLTGDGSKDEPTQVLVKHCRVQRGGWALGCQYLIASSASQETMRDSRRAHVQPVRN